LEGELGLEYDCSGVGDIASGFLPQPIALQGKRATSINFASEYPADGPNKLLANLRTNKCRLGFDKADYRGLSFGVTDVNAQFTNGVLKIDPFSSRVNNGQINFAANADFTKPTPTIEIPQPISMKGIEINETLSREFKGLFAFLNPVFKDALGVGGTLDLSAEKLLVPLADERRNDIQIAGALAMDNVNFIPTGLMGEILALIGLGQKRSVGTVYPTKFTVKDGFLSYDDAMRIDIARLPLYFRGIVGVGLNRTVDMQVELPLGDTAKQLGFNVLPLAGTTDKPTLDTSKMGKNVLENIFKGLLDKDVRDKGLLDGLLK